ncbi:hypothetical protein [Flexivirga alba]|uniref:Uncharacterized protein n=1 Tax=Flexivirga alba TaxID=702742 RepID=A0ABW2AJY1_9MICO
MATTLAIIAIVIALLSAGFTGWQAYTDHDRRREEKSDRRTRVAAAEKAEVRATFNGQQVVVENRGPATAHNVTVELRPAEGEAGEAPTWLGMSDALPELPKGSFFRGDLATDYETAAAFIAIVTFTDGAGNHVEPFPIHRANPSG